MNIFVKPLQISRVAAIIYGEENLIVKAHYFHVRELEQKGLKVIRYWHTQKVDEHPAALVKTYNLLAEVEAINERMTHGKSTNDHTA